MDLEVLLYTTVLALVNVLGVFTSEIGFRTPKIQRSDVLALRLKQDQIGTSCVTFGQK